MSYEAFNQLDINSWWFKKDSLEREMKDVSSPMLKWQAKDNNKANILVKCLSFSTKGNIDKKDGFFNKTVSLIGRVGMHYQLTVQIKGNRK